MFYFSYFTKRNHFKNFEKCFFPLFIQSFVVFSFLLSQFPDLQDKTKKAIFVSMYCNSERLVTSYRHFAFQNFVHKKWQLGAKEKINFSFSWSHFVLKTTTTPKYCNVQIRYLQLFICTSGHHKFSKFIKLNFNIKTLKCIECIEKKYNYMTNPTTKIFFMKIKATEENWQKGNFVTQISIFSF